MYEREDGEFGGTNIPRLSFLLIKLGVSTLSATISSPLIHFVRPKQHDTSLQFDFKAALTMSPQNPKNAPDTAIKNVGPNVSYHIAINAID